MSLFDTLDVDGATKFFMPPVDLLEMLAQSTDGFHVIVGLDPFGTFTAVRGLQAEHSVFTYEELGRNSHPVQLPFNGPQKMGEVTLEWGTVLRGRFWNWFNAQTPYFAERQPVFIVHLSRKSLPIRVYLLWGAWPRQWSYSDLGTNQMAVESVTIVYDRLFMLPTALLTLGPGSVVTAPEESSGTPASRPRASQRAPAEAPDVNTWNALLEEERAAPAERPKTDVAPVPRRWEALVEEQRKETERRAPPKAKAPVGWVALPEDRKGVAGQFANREIPTRLQNERPVRADTPVQEDYTGVLGTWGTEALPETYVGRARAWGGASAGTWRDEPAPSGGEGKSVKEDDE